jgi:hypothetical protein
MCALYYSSIPNINLPGIAASQNDIQRIMQRFTIQKRLVNKTEKKQNQ